MTEAEASLGVAAHDVAPHDFASDDKLEKQRIFRKLRDRQSVCCEPGMEGKCVTKGTHTGKSIAVFTSGGDAQGCISYNI